MMCENTIRCVCAEIRSVCVCVCAEMTCENTIRCVCVCVGGGGGCLLVVLFVCVLWCQVSVGCVESVWCVGWWGGGGGGGGGGFFVLLSFACDLCIDVDT